MMERLSERLAMAAAVLFAASAIGSIAARNWTGHETVGGLMPFHLAALLVALVTWMRASLQRRADEEALDLAAAPRHEDDHRLFRPDEDGEPFTAARSKALFDRFAVPGTAPVLALGLGLLAAWRFRRQDVPVWPVPAAELGGAAVLVATAFIFFLLGRYLIALSRIEQRRILRPVGILAALVPALHLFTAGILLATRYGIEPADRWGSAILAGVLLVLAVEMALLSIAEIYRPRRSDAAAPPSYESRLVRFIADPAGLARGASRALDYQFGFRVSETWFYRFLERALLPLICLQAVLLYALSSVVILGPEEEAIVERFGRASGELHAAAGRHLTPGFHVTWPWPFETVRRFPARRLQHLNVGFVEGAERETTILWTRPHFEAEDLFLTASRELEAAAAGDDAVPVNFLTFAISIEYEVSDLPQFLYRHSRPQHALKDLAYRALTLESAGRGLFDILGERYRELSEAMRVRVQADADRIGLGVRIAGVLVRGVHPPVAVAEDFEAVVGAVEEREAQILEANAYRNRRIPVALAEAQQRLFEAEAYRERRVAVSEAEQQQFLSRRAGHDASPLVFRARHRLEAIRNAVQGARLYLMVADPDHEVIQINLEERTPATLFDTSPDGRE